MKGKRGRTDIKEWLISDIQNEDWVIIEEDIWDKAQKIRLARTTKKVGDETEIHTSIPKQTKSELLFVGMIHCGSCGAAITTTKNIAKWTTKDGVKHKISKAAYKCINKSMGRDCSGKSVYNKDKLEDTIVSEVFVYLTNLTTEDLTNKIISKINNDTKNELKKVKLLEQELNVLYKENDTLKGEVTKCIQGNSKFSGEILSALISEKAEVIKDKEQKLKDLKYKVEENKSKFQDIIKTQKRMPNWIKEFEESQLETKKMILSEIIQDVIVYPDSLDIIFNVNINEFIKFVNDL